MVNHIIRLRWWCRDNCHHDCALYRHSLLRIRRGPGSCNTSVVAQPRTGMVCCVHSSDVFIRHCIYHLYNLRSRLINEFSSFQLGTTKCTRHGLGHCIYGCWWYRVIIMAEWYVRLTKDTRQHFNYILLLYYRVHSLRITQTILTLCRYKTVNVEVVS